jgi:hypothetical protein
VGAIREMALAVSASLDGEGHGQHREGERDDTDHLEGLWRVKGKERKQRLTRELPKDVSCSIMMEILAWFNQVKIMDAVKIPVSVFIC